MRRLAKLIKFLWDRLLLRDIPKGQGQSDKTPVNVETLNILNAHKPAPPLLKKKLERCLHADKVCFTREQATYQRDKNSRGLNLRIYVCQFCNFWHLTSKKRYDW